jgi:predicted DNA-binding transcriptional regulator YafY
MTVPAIPAHRYGGQPSRRPPSSDEISEAIARSWVIQFSYPSSKDGAPIVRTLSPYLLEGGGEIVKGWDHDRECVRRYQLARMDDVELPSDAEFVNPA